MAASGWSSTSSARSPAIHGAVLHLTDGQPLVADLLALPAPGAEGAPEPSAGTAQAATPAVPDGQDPEPEAELELDEDLLRRIRDVWTPAGPGNARVSRR